ncbi:hypothetical protein GCM10027265_10530 [Jatrophihabitans fulvus]
MREGLRARDDEQKDDGDHKDGSQGRPLASPLPVGLLGLTVGSLMLCGKQFGWLADDQGQALALCLLGFVAPLQLLGFVFAVLARDGGFAVAAAVYAGTWTATGLVGLVTPPGGHSPALGLLLIAAAAALLAPLSTSVRSKPLIAVIVALGAVRFVTSGVFELGGSAASATVSGCIGLALSAVGLYAGVAYTLEDVTGRAVLPTLRRGDDGVEAEAGVRDEL